MAQVDSTVNPESTRTEQPRPPLVKKRAPEKNTDSINQAAALREAMGEDTTPSAVVSDTPARKDSIRKTIQPVPTQPIHIDTGTYKKYETHPFLPLNKPAVYMLINYHRQDTKDDLFYLMAGIVFLLAFIRAAFPKYFRNLFVVFFQTTLRQKQTREQLLQDNLASLLINLLYFISVGLYVSLLIQYRHWSTGSFWLLALGCALILLLVYLGKYLFLLFAGWVFNTKEAAGAYTFIVFMVNKVMGVILIPFLLILAFAVPAVIDVSITVAIILVTILFAYRYLVSFAAIRNKLKVNAVHFFLYLCAVEVLPLVLIYKMLINYIAGSF